MLNNAVFYHAITQKIIVMFGDLFNNMTIRRTDANSNVVQEVRVPILYGPRDKWLATSDLVGERGGVQIHYPRMAFVINSLAYDSSRKGVSTQKFREVTADNSTLYRAWNSVPYNVGITLSIISRFTEDGLKIIEQIIPFFTPAFSVTIDWIPSLNIRKDTPITLNTVSPNEEYESGKDPAQRTSTWDLDFTIQTDYLGPIIEQGVIVKSISQLYANAYSSYATSSGIFEEPDSAELTRAVSRYIVEPNPITANALSDYTYTDSWERREQ